MVIYEVQLQVARDIETPYRLWLSEHVSEILGIPGFIKADIFAVPTLDTEETFQVCVQYHLHSLRALDDYLRDHAPRLRGDGEMRFAGKFTAHRRVLHLQNSLYAP